jgi:DNA polymerase-3 subunit gamma/tau
MSEITSNALIADPASPGRYVVIARRYRPQSFEELVGQEHIARALQQAIVSDRVGHAYLFTGARGTGKTSAARILAKAINCEYGPTPTPCNKCDICESVSTGDDVDVLEIDGASNNGVDQVRQLRQNAAVRPTRTRYKIYIIDEVHMLSGSAFNALLKTLEEPPEHVKFIFATTEPQKIPITILSRCQRFDFAGISATSIQERLSQIATAEGVEIDREALQILASRAAGSMRDSQSLLEQLLAIGRKRITADNVTQLLGTAPAERLGDLVRHLVNRDAAAALAELDAIVVSGVEVGFLLDQLVGYFRDTMAAAVGCSSDQLLYALPSQADEVAQVADQLGLPTILAVGQILDQAAARMRVSMHGRTLVEMAIVRICQLHELDDLAELIAELRGAGESVKSPATASKLQPPAKKNASDGPERQMSSSLADAYQGHRPNIQTSTLELPAQEPGFERRRDPAHSAETSRIVPSGAEISATPDDDSVVARYQRRMAEGGVERNSVTQPRLSRREQTNRAAEHPLVRRAMELFDAPPEKLRYTPPEERCSGVEQ